MPVKIRLQRHGRKKFAYYHIVVADSRAPRDGRFIERIGSYNPNTNPATIDLDFDKALSWLNKGAQPTDTVRNILSYKGVLYKKHLLGGVAKGAFTDEEAERRFSVWMAEKAAKIMAKRDRLLKDAELSKEAALAAETKINQERAAAIAKKEAQALAAAQAAAQDDSVVAEAPETVAETSEAVAEEVSAVEEAKAVAEESPVAETLVAEAPETVAETSEAVAEEVSAVEEAEAVAETLVAEESSESVPEADTNTEAEEKTAG